jgi:hypothetical protein
MTCAEFEIIVSDYVDGTLHGEARVAFEQHRSGCAACRELAQDAAAVVAFMDRTATVEPPPELVTRILFEIPRGKPAEQQRKRSGFKRFLQRWLQPVLQPRFAMGMAMTILSFSMLGRFTGISPRQLKPSDLDPVKVWASIDDRVHRTWDRAVKYYENLRLVYEIQSRLREWNQQEEEERKTQQPSTPPGQPNQGAPDQQQRERSKP